MRSVLGVTVVIAVIVAVLIVLHRKPGPIGFQKVTAPDPDDQPLTVGVWYPRSADDHTEVAGSGLPLIVISHGTGGGMKGHEDTARALAEAGFVVAAVIHTGDNFKDHRYVGEARSLSDRPRHIARVIDYMLTSWSRPDHIDPERIGIFGFSSGGFTALAVIGGVPDLSRTIAYCAEKPEAWSCRYIKKHGWTPENATRTPTSRWVRDARVKAAVVAAPAVGWSFEPDGLTAVTVPIQLWAVSNDHIVPYTDNTAVVRRLLSVAPEYHEVSGADHYAFLAPCSWVMRGLFAIAPWFGGEDICHDPPGFDRVAFHLKFNQSAVQFFSEKLAGS